MRVDKKTVSMFQNRTEGGMLLASKLRKYKNTETVILAVPRGGVPVGYEVAKELNLALEVLLVKKLQHPLNKDFTIGAVGLTESYLIRHQNVTEYFIDVQIHRIRERLKELQKRLYADRPVEKLEGKTVIVIDDGISTGHTVLSSLHIIKMQHPSRIVVAAPMISKFAVEKLSKVVDEIIAVLIPESFYRVSGFYEDFTQVTDDEVVRYMQKLHLKEDLVTDIE
jgi:putative phosphoribosyl transferase